MKPDERNLFLAFALAGGKAPVFLRELGESLGMPSKRVCYLASKWSGKGWYDWGITVDLGWLTPKGFAAAEDLRNVVA